jgi:hypothetical protein
MERIPAAAAIRIPSCRVVSFCSWRSAPNVRRVLGGISELVSPHIYRPPDSGFAQTLRASGRVTSRIPGAASVALQRRVATKRLAGQAGGLDSVGPLLLLAFTAVAAAAAISACLQSRVADESAMSINATARGVSTGRVESSSTVMIARIAPSRARRASHSPRTSFRSMFVRRRQGWKLVQNENSDGRLGFDERPALIEKSIRCGFAAVRLGEPLFTDRGNVAPSVAGRTNVHDFHDLGERVFGSRYSIADFQLHADRLKCHGETMVAASGARRA